MGDHDRAETFKLKQAAGKIPVHYLNTSTDFPTWHVVLRRVVVGYNMVDALMYTVPTGQEQSMRARMKSVSGSIKKEGDFDPIMYDEESKAVIPPVVVDLTVEAPLKTVAKDEKTLVLMKSLGISVAVDTFFSASTDFINIRTDAPDTERESAARQEIWLWMEKSLSQGQYKWVVNTVGTMFDIHELHRLVVNLCNKVTWVSWAMEYRKVFTMDAKPGTDVFLYHSELQEQIKKVKLQSEALGIDPSISPWGVNALLLVAAYKEPKFQKIALEFTMNDKAITASTLLKDLQRQQLLSTSAWWTRQ